MSQWDTNEREVEELFSIIEDAIAENGYKVIDGDDEIVFVRSDDSGYDYSIIVKACED